MGSCRTKRSAVDTLFALDPAPGELEAESEHIFCRRSFCSCHVVDSSRLPPSLLLFKWPLSQASSRLSLDTLHIYSVSLTPVSISWFMARGFFNRTGRGEDDTFPVRGAYFYHRSPNKTNYILPYYLVLDCALIGAQQLSEPRPALSGGSIKDHGHVRRGRVGPMQVCIWIEPLVIFVKFVVFLCEYNFHRRRSQPLPPHHPNSFRNHPPPFLEDRPGTEYPYEVEELAIYKSGADSKLE